MKASLKFWTVLLCAGLVIGGCCDDPISPETPDNEDENLPVEQPEKPLTDGSLFTVQLNDDIMATVGTGDWNAVACSYPNTFIAVGRFGDIALSTDGGNTWNVENIGGTDYQYNDIAFSNNLVIAVNSKGGYASGFRRSMNWNIHQVSDNSNERFTSFAVDDNYDVSVILSPDRGTIYYSTDHRSNWTSKKILDYANFADMIFANGKFVIAGLHYGALSENGIDWDIIDYSKYNSISINIAKLAYGNGLLVGAGKGIYTSQDGAVWTQKITRDIEFKDITYANGTFVAITNNSAYISIDGINWSNEIVLGVTEDLNCVCIMQ